MEKEKSNIFDFNYNPEINRTIFVSEFYFQSGENGGNVYNFSIQFDDLIS